MKKYSVSEFLDGESVFHLSNSHLKMIVIGRNESTNEVECRWVENSGKPNKENYLAVELGKWADKPPLPMPTLVPRRSRFSY